MSAPFHQLRVDQGARFDLTMLYQQPGGAPVDLAGTTVTLTVQDENGVALGDVTVTGDTSGRLDFHIPDDVTSAWPPGRLAYHVDHHTTKGPDRLVVGVIDCREAHRV